MRTFKNIFVFIIFTLRLMLAVSEDKHQKFYDEMLKLHNSYRDKHNAGPLTINEKMSEDAMEFAKRWMQGHHSVTDMNWSYGENVYGKIMQSISPVDITAKNVFHEWYDIRDKYDYSNEEGRANSFTQIVWKDTKQIGIAKLQEDTKAVVVVTYFPKGNIKEQYLANVEKNQTNKRAKMYKQFMKNVVTQV